jgi:exo-beta-1,3-glucanase (GH17 family)
MGRDDDILASADKGSTILKDVRRHVYEIEGYRCNSLEEVERIAAQQGIALRELDYRPEMIQAGAGRYDIIVRFVSKNTRDKRDQWNR